MKWRGLLSFAAVVACGIFPSGCCTTETWTKTGRTRVYIKDVECVRSNGVACAVKIIGHEDAAIWPWGSWRRCEDVIEIARAQIVEKRAVRLCRGAKGSLANVTNHVIAVSRQVWMDDERLANRMADVLDQRSVVLLADLHAWRRYLAVPVQFDDWSDDATELTFIVLGAPWIAYDRNCYLKEASAGTVCVRRSLLLPFAVVCDVITFPVQFFLGIFTHM